MLRRIVLARADHRQLEEVLQIAATGNEELAALEHLLGQLGVGHPLAVAAAAGPERALLLHAIGVHDGPVAATGLDQELAAHHVAVGAHVRVGGAVTGLAGDAHLGKLPVPRRVRAPGSGPQTRVRAGVVAEDAARVPELRVARQVHPGRVGVDEDLAEREPGLVHLVPDEGQDEVGAVLPPAQVDLLDVRADEAIDPEGAPRRLAGRPPPARPPRGLPLGVEDLHEEVVAGAEHPPLVALEPDAGVVEVAEHGRGRDVLGHGAVVGAAPGAVVVGVTLHAGGGGLVAAERRVHLARLGDDGAEQETRHADGAEEQAGRQQRGDPGRQVAEELHRGPGAGPCHRGGEDPEAPRRPRVCHTSQTVTPRPSSRKAAPTGTSQIPIQGSLSEGRTPPRKKPSGSSTRAPRRKADASRACSSVPSQAPVSAPEKTSCTTESSVPWACARRHISRRRWTSGSRKKPSLSPFSASSVSPRLANRRRPVQPQSWWTRASRSIDPR